MAVQEFSSMAHLQRSKASLRVFGEHVLPAEISELLGTLPTAAHAKGDLWPLSGRMGIRTAGMWLLEAQVKEPEDLDNQVAELLGRTTSDLGMWKALSARFQVDLFCGWFMGSNNEGVAISPTTMVALGSRGIALSIDIYGASSKDDN